MKTLRTQIQPMLIAVLALAFTVDSQAAITNDLVVHLTFDQTLDDASGRANHGAAVGTPSFVAGRVGTHGVALSSRKDGTSFNYVTLGAPADLNFGTDVDFSVAFWTQFSIWTFDPPFVGNKDWLSGNNPGYMIATGTDGRLQWNYGGPPGLRKDYDGPAGTLSDGQWHHVAVTFLRAGEVITYLDGQEVDVRDVTASLNNLDTIVGQVTNVGQDGTGRYTDGQAVGVDDLVMDDLGIWRRVLSATEVESVHQAGLAGDALTSVTSVLELPTLPRPPQDQSVVAGESVSFKAIPRGTSPFAFQWQLNGMDLPEGTGAILTLTNAQAGQAGPYTVRITNAAGTLVSDPAVLTVDTTQPPTLLEPPLAQAAAPGGTARFKVVAAGVSPLRFQWRKEGLDLPGASSATLTLNRVKTADVGKYSVVVTAGNQLATTSAEVTLELIEDITKDLVAHLTFDQDFTDASGRQNHGIPKGEPGLVEGKVGGKALRFSTRADGTAINYVTLGEPADLDFGYDADYSFSFWLRFSQWTRDPVLIANKSWFNSGSLIGYALAVGSDGRFQWNFKEQVGERADFDSAPGLISDGQWHHVAVAFQRGGDATTWFDGRQIDSRPLPASGTVIEPGLPLNVGQDGTGAYTEGGAASIEDGTLDDLAIWRRAITGDEAAAIYAKGMAFGANVQQPAVTDGLVVHLPFDGDFQDRSGRQHHGTAVGQPGFAIGQVGTHALQYATLTNGPAFNHVTLGSPSDLDFGSDTDFTVSFWTRFRQWSGDPPFLGNKNWGSGGNQGWVIATAGNGRLQWNLGDGDGGGRTRVDYDGPENMLGDDRWHHVAVTIDRQGSAHTYLDGRLTNTTVVVAELDSIDTPTGMATNIGQDGTGAYTDNLQVGIGDGQIDDVGIWRRVLQPAEVVQIHQQGLQGVNLLGQAPVPALTIAATGATITLDWPDTAAGFVLERSPDLGGGTAWQAVPGVNGTQHSLNPSQAAGFYRLRKP